MAYKDPIKKKEYAKAYYQANKEEEKFKKKAWRKANKAYLNSYEKRYREANKIECAQYSQKYKAQDLNSLGQTKYSIRRKSQYYLRKYGKPIEGYEIHHCFTYNEPYKFIYCSRQMHRLIHSYLKQHNIDADTEHYEYIKHLLDDSVIKYNVD